MTNGEKGKAKRKNLVIAVGLADALKMVEQIHRQGGGNEVPKEALESIINSKITSSFFERKLSALKTYGLIEVYGNMVSLSQLGKAYAASISPENKRQAAFQAFTNVPLFSSLAERYCGNPLPEINQFFYNLLGSTYEVPHEEAPKWTKEFIAGARLTGILVSENGQEVILLPSSVGAPSPRAQGGAPMMSSLESSGQYPRMLSAEQSGSVFAMLSQGQLEVKVSPNVPLKDLRKSIRATKRLLTMLEDMEKELEEETPDLN